MEDSTKDLLLLLLYRALEGRAEGNRFYWKGGDLEHQRTHPCSEGGFRKNNKTACCFFQFEIEKTLLVRHSTWPQCLACQESAFHATVGISSVAKGPLAGACRGIPWATWYPKALTPTLYFSKYQEHKPCIRSTNIRAWLPTPTALYSVKILNLLLKIRSLKVKDGRTKLQNTMCLCAVTETLSWMGAFGSEAGFYVYPNHTSALSLLHFTPLAKRSKMLWTITCIHFSGISINTVCLTFTASPCKRKSTFN